MGENQKPLGWSYTNESLNAVLAAFRVHGAGVIDKRKNVLAVCGSGDIPFALLEFARQVVVVDNNPAQIDYARKRADYLLKGDYAHFVEPQSEGVYDGEKYCPFLPNKGLRDRYFQDRETIDRIKARLEGLVFCEPQDVFTFLENRNQTFSAIYLSNVLGTFAGNSFRDFRRKMRPVSKRLSYHGRVFMSDADHLFPPDIHWTSLTWHNHLSQEQITLMNKVLKGILIVDKEATYSSRLCELPTWSPIVLTK
jgi:SAM-dependent methyltransferase